GGEHVARAAKGVARILVQQQDKGQRGLWPRGPVLEAQPRRPKVRIAEAARELGVESLILGEPAGGARIAPEVQQFPRIAGHHGIGMPVWAHRSSSGIARPEW